MVVSPERSPPAAQMIGPGVRVMVIDLSMAVLDHLVDSIS